MSRHRLWLVYWMRGEPSIRRYQWPVSALHVLSEHRAAIKVEAIGEPE